jgi:hypothetical protein
VIIYSEGGTKLQEDEANSILETISFAYPGHPWGVRVYDGGVFIRHLDFPSNWGMNVKYKTAGYSASAFKRELILMVGEWLERANLKRGRWDETPIARVEGVPEKWQPKPEVKIDLSAADWPERDQPRPLAVELAQA